MSKDQSVFLVFQGGGSLGLAYSGALAALQETRDFEIEGVAGTSAGSIAAVFCAAKVSGKNLFDLSSDDGGDLGVLDFNFAEKFLNEQYSPWKTVMRREGNSRIEHVDREIEVSHPKKVMTAFSRYMAKARALGSIIYHSRKFLSERGVFDISSFEVWLDDTLKKVIYDDPAERHREPLKLCDLKIPTCIIASNMSNGEMKVFESGPTRCRDEPHTTCGHATIGEAVAASIAIPFVFKPKLIEQGEHIGEYVDGGLCSNFPFWIFEKQRPWPAGIQKPIIGFRVKSNQNRGSVKAPNGKGAFGYLGDLSTLAVNGRPTSYDLSIRNIHEINIECGFSSFQFDMTNEERKQLVIEGTNQVRSALSRKLALLPSSKVNCLLVACRRMISKKIGVGHSELRANVMVKVSDREHMVIFSSNMESDTDDCLILPTNSGIASACYQSGDTVAISLESPSDGTQDSKSLNKYETALVNQNLRCILSTPIYSAHPKSAKKNKSEKISEEIIGILNIDSENDYGNDLESEYVRASAIKCSFLLTKMLNKHHV